MSSDPRPIGVFDSGLGGLTVLSALKTQLPDESFIYLGDTARLPYGTKSPESIKKYCGQNLQFLLRRRVKAVVVACNSASTQCREDKLGVTPVYNMIDPGAQTALEKSLTKRIGVLGTRATIQSDCYPSAIRALDCSSQVFSQACPLLVPLAEEGWIDDPVTNLIVYRYVSGLLQNNIDTLILGCTHYPILKNSIAKVAGPGVHLIDSGSAVSRMLMSDIGAGKIQAAPQGDGQAFIELLTTDYSEHTLARALAIAAPYRFSKVEKVDL